MSLEQTQRYSDIQNCHGKSENITVRGDPGPSMVFKIFNVSNPSIHWINRHDNLKSF